jgi:zinc protease
VWCAGEPASAARRVDKTLSRRLDNGLEVILSEAREQPVFSLDVRYRVGARNDPRDLDELAHLVEHLSFQYSRHIGREGSEVSDLAGVMTNGSTGDDDTVFLNSGPAGALSRVLWLERQRMAFALKSFSEADVTTERRTLDNERSSMRVDRLGGMFWQFVDAALYPADHPYAPRPERGCILHCELRHVQWLMQRGYRPDNARLVVVGDFDADALLKDVTRLFGSIENPGVRLPPLADAPLHSAPQRITIAAPVVRPRLHLFWDVPPPLHGKLAALYVLDAELEQLLKVALVDSSALANEVDVELNQLELGWLWSVWVDLLPGIDPKFVEERVLAQLAGLRQHAPNIDAARQRAITQLLEVWDTPGARARFLSRDPSFGIDHSRTIAELRAVSAEDVSGLARQLFREKPALSVHVRRAVDAPARGELYREPE